MDTLPIELRLKIVRYLDIEVLLSLEYKDKIMWEILHTSSQKKTETWLVEYVSNFGIIYIKDSTYFGLFNEEEEDEDEEYIEKSINLWDSRLQEGFYKLRFLYEGFDLVKIGNYFLSSQDGPLRSFDLPDYEWGTSYKSRGFELVTEVDKGLSPASFELSSGIRPISKQITIVDTKATFYIVYQNTNNVSSNIESKVMKQYNTDSTYSTYNPITPYILKKGKEIVGYKLQSRIWCAYDVTDEAHSDEGYYEFSVSWYRYLNKEKCKTCGSIPINLLIGFIITGSQNEYIYPGTIEDSDFKYPDKESEDVSESEDD